MASRWRRGAQCAVAVAATRAAARPASTTAVASGSSRSTTTTTTTSTTSLPTTSRPTTGASATSAPTAPHAAKGAHATGETQTTAPTKLDPAMLPWLREGMTQLQSAAREGNRGLALAQFDTLRQRVADTETLPQDAYRWLVASWRGPHDTHRAPLALASDIASAFGPAPRENDLNRVVVGLCQAGQLDSALDATDLMRDRGIAPKLDTFNALLLGVQKLGKAADAGLRSVRHLPPPSSELIQQWVQRIRASMAAARRQPDATTFVRLLHVHQSDLLALPALVDEASRALDTSSPSPILLGALVRANLSLGRHEAARHHFDTLLCLCASHAQAGDSTVAGHAPAPSVAATAATAAGAAMMRALAAKDDFDGALAVHDALDRTAGVPATASSLSAVLSTLLKGSRRLQRPIRAWRPVADRAMALADADAAVFTAVVQLLLHEPDLVRSNVRRRRDEALDIALAEADAVLAQMLRRGVVPDNVFLSTLLRGYADWWPQQERAQAGARLNRALQVLAVARERGVVPNAHVFTALVLCCKEAVHDPPAAGPRHERLDRRLDSVLQSMRQEGIPMDLPVYTAWVHVLLATHESKRLMQMWCTARLDTAEAAAAASIPDLDALVLREAAATSPTAASKALALYNELRTRSALPAPSPPTLEALLQCCGCAHDSLAFDAALAELRGEWARQRTKETTSANRIAYARAYSAALEASARLRDLDRAEAAFRDIAEAASPAALPITAHAWQALLRTTVQCGSLQRAEALWADPVAAPAWNAVLPALTMATARAADGRYADAVSLFEWTTVRAQTTSVQWEQRHAIANTFAALFRSMRNSGRSAATVAAVQRLVALADRTHLDNPIGLDRQHPPWYTEATQFLTASAQKQGPRRIATPAADLRDADDGFGSSDDD